MIVIRSRWALPLAIGALTIIHEQGAAFAAGFGLREGATDWMANSYAGQTAKAYDASTAFTNPAGMVRLDQSELDGSLNGIFPTVNFSGTNTIDGVPVAGSTAGNDAQSGASPAAFGVWNFSPDLKFGFSITAPFGQRITYASDFVGRYQGLVSSITDVTVSLSAAYRIDDHFSIGAGPVLDWFYARLTRRSTLARWAMARSIYTGRKSRRGLTWARCISSTQPPALALTTARESSRTSPLPRRFRRLQRIR